jgi:uncharacterized protein (DUF1499 family)
MSKTGQTWAFIAGIGAAVAMGYWGWSNRRLFSVHDITTGESAAYPELRSRVYYAEVSRTFTAAEQSLRRLPGWKLMGQDTDNVILDAEVQTAYSPLPDDVTVYFFPLSHGQTRVTIRARSRSGMGDLGRNAAHIRSLQAAMDNRLNADAAF